MQLLQVLIVSLDFLCPCELPEGLLWFWFCDTQLKTTLFGPPIKTSISCVSSVEARWPPDRAVPGTNPG